MAVRQRAFLFLSALLLAGAVDPARGEDPQKVNQAGPRGPHEGVAGFRVEILVDGQPVRQYVATGSGSVRYVEALEGKTYAIRLRNPLSVRVAVALAVDGLNTIDGRHTSARDARKWVLEPHETATISGWQMSLKQARQFYFTSEQDSYAHRLGRAENVGIVSAVFFRERVTRFLPLGIASGADAPGRGGAEGAPAPQAAAKSKERMEDEYAATGIGDRIEHHVRRVHLELEETPAGACDIRYEFRSQLARLGILPGRGPDVPARRDRARGFEDGFCPEPER